MTALKLEIEPKIFIYKPLFLKKEVYYKVKKQSSSDQLLQVQV